MIECAFASETPRGTLCRYNNRPCYMTDGWRCPTMDNAVKEFEGLLSNLKIFLYEQNWSEEFMEGVVRKYGNKEEICQQK